MYCLDPCLQNHLAKEPDKLVFLRHVEVMFFTHGLTSLHTMVLYLITMLHMLSCGKQPDEIHQYGTIQQCKAGYTSEYDTLHYNPVDPSNTSCRSMGLEPRTGLRTSYSQSNR